MAKTVRKPKPQRRVLTKSQKAFLISFEKKACNVSQASKAVGVDRRTVYRWITSNVSFKEKYDDIMEGMIDMAESALYTNMMAGKETSLIFFLKTRGRNRGYQEIIRQEVEMQDHKADSDLADFLADKRK
jgi:hypothetical protein